MEKTEMEKLLDVFDGISRDVRRSRDPRAVRRLDQPLTSEELEEWKKRIRGVFDKSAKKGVDNDEEDPYDIWRREQERAEKSGPVLLDPLNPPEAGKIRKLEFEETLKSMKSDIVSQMEKEAQDLVFRKLKINKGRVDL